MDYQIIADDETVWILGPEGEMGIPIEEWWDMVIWWITEECQPSLSHE